MASGVLCANAQIIPWQVATKACYSASWTRHSNMAAAAALWASMLSHLLQIPIDTDGYKRNLLYLVIFINFTSALYYTLASLEKVPCVFGFGRWAFAPLRFVHWSITAPAALYVLCHLSTSIKMPRVAALVSSCWALLVLAMANTILGGSSHVLPFRSPLAAYATEEGLRSAAHVAVYLLVVAGIAWIMWEASSRAPCTRWCWREREGVPDSEAPCRSTWCSRAPGAGSVATAP